MSVSVKICGITRLDDALRACELGADALGFVFHRPSPRFIVPAAARAIIERLPAFVTTVGVFVDLPAEQIEAAAREACLDRVQLSGSESPEYCRSLTVRWIKALRVSSAADIDGLAAYGGGRDFLLDTFVEGSHGGTGRTFEWTWARRAARCGRIIIAGGLKPDNVAEAINSGQPWGVDVASGVESAPGVKDHGLLERFIRQARAAD